MLAQIEQSFAVREASEERMRQFVADASHELRTPLAAVRGYAELFRQGAVSTPEDVATAMRRIEDEATRMGGLVQDLLLLARLDDQRPMQFAPVDLTVLVADAAAGRPRPRPDQDGHRPRPRRRPGADRGAGRRRAAAPGAHQPGRQRRQPHPRRHRRSRSPSAARRPAAPRSRCATTGPASTRPRPAGCSSASTAPTPPARAARAAAAAWAWPSWPRSSRRTAARSGSRRPPAEARRSSWTCPQHNSQQAPSVV